VTPAIDVYSVKEIVLILWKKQQNTAQNKYCEECAMKYLFLIMLAVVLFGSEQSPEEAALATLRPMTAEEISSIKQSKQRFVIRKIDASERRDFLAGDDSTRRTILQNKLDLISSALSPFGHQEEKEAQFMSMMSAYEYLYSLLYKGFSVAKDECFVEFPSTLKPVGDHFEVVRDMRQHKDDEGLFSCSKICKIKVASFSLERADFLFFSQISCEKSRVMEEEYLQVITKFANEFRLLVASSCLETQNMQMQCPGRGMSDTLVPKIVAKMQFMRSMWRIAMHFCCYVENKDLAKKNEKMLWSHMKRRSVK